MPPDSTFVTTTRATAVALLSSETVIFRVRKDILFLIIPLILMTGIGVALFLVINALHVVPILIPYVRLGVLVVTLFIDLIIFLDWLGTVYTLTNRRVQYRFGIVGEQNKTISLNQITDSRVQISILGRIFNYGSVIIEAANINSQITFRGIKAPEDRLNQINSQLPQQ